MKNSTIVINEEVVKLINERKRNGISNNILVDMPHGSNYLLSEFVIISEYELSNATALFMNLDIKGVYNNGMFWFASKDEYGVSIAAYFESGAMHGMVQIPTYEWYSIVKPCLRCYIEELSTLYDTKVSSWYMNHDNTWSIPKFNKMIIPEFNLPF